MPESIGLSSQQAVGKLWSCLHETLLNERKNFHLTKLQLIRFSFSHSSQFWFCWAHAGIQFFTLLSLFIYTTSTDCSVMIRTSLALCCIVQLALLFVNILITLRFVWLKSTELFRKAHLLIDSLKTNDFSDNSNSLNLSVKDSIQLHFTIRDGKIRQMPSLALVPGDIILVRPGHEFPCRCRSLTDNKIFFRGQLFAPPCPAPVSHPSLYEPVEPLNCEILECPASLYILDALQQKPIETVFDRQMRRILHNYIERYVIIFAILFALIAGILRIILTNVRSEDAFLYWPVLTILPLSGLMLPLCIIATQIHGLTKLLHMHEPGKGHIFELLKGNPQYLPCSANLLEVLGNISSLCVVDKIGILSWPNPTPEKIMVCNLTEQCEVLDLSHDREHPLKCEFDDPLWSYQIGQLKAIGLNIMLNSCQYADDYFRFQDHLAVVSESVPRTVACDSRHCLCYLAELIGFQKSSVYPFKGISTIGVYRRYPSSRISSGMTKHRIPIANCFSVLVEERSSKRTHLLSNGTADCVLDACAYYWDGSSIRHLNKQMQRKIQDFYQRWSMTAFCQALSYCSFNEMIDFGPNLKRNYVEIGISEKPFLLKQRMRATMISLEKNSKHSISCDGLIDLYPAIDLVDDAVSAMQRTFCDHVFLGLIAMQYQAHPNAISLVEKLDKACIRFVHFSKENELRSRVFAEKLGLEAGWNCHISLNSEGSEQIIETLNKPQPSPITQRRMSVPDHFRINLSCVQFSTIEFHSPPPNSPVKRHLSPIMDVNSWQYERISLAEDIQSIFNRPAGGISTDFSEQYPLLSDNVSQKSESWTAPIMPNYARLPKGIEQIRPHLELVDNVPLLVPLFTDSSPDSVEEMLSIMKEYGEVICVVGSSLNFNNVRSFVQADCSVSVFPFQPSICIHSTNSQQSSSVLQLASRIASLPCSLLLDAAHLSSLFDLIGQSRHWLSQRRQSLNFYLTCSLSLSVLQLMSLILTGRPFPNLTFLYWLIIIVIPSLTIGIYFHRFDDSILRAATAKREGYLRPSDIKSYAVGFAIKFLPSLFVIRLLHSLTAISLCNQQSMQRLINNQSSIYCHSVFLSNYELVDSVAWHIADWLNAIWLVLYFVTISASYVHYRTLLFVRWPCSSVVWLVISIGLIVAQILLSHVAILTTNKDLLKYWYSVPTYIWLIGFIWVFIILALNELIKRREIKIYNRHQRRRRLSFDTKLGMNSPF